MADTPPASAAVQNVRPDAALILAGQSRCVLSERELCFD
ncbi:hypothetical protein X736_01925 [Mesorhizobium sp. L2C089B000]|nr:hypothetical protein X736_01925 [Mesorhizobium sp. L2C089B000]